MTTRILRRSAFAFAVVMAGSSLASAQQPAVRTTGAPPAAGSADANALPRPLRAKQLLGMKISMQNNTAIGTVDDIVLSDGGDVEYLVVARDDGKLVSVPWSAAVFNVEQKSVVVNITPQQYQAIPTYTATTYPDFFTPTYRTNTYKYYNVTPGQFRRIERRLTR